MNFLKNIAHETMVRIPKPIAGKVRISSGEMIPLESADDQRLGAEMVKAHPRYFQIVSENDIAPPVETEPASEAVIETEPVAVVETEPASEAVVETEPVAVVEKEADSDPAVEDVPTSLPEEDSPTIETEENQASSIEEDSKDVSSEDEGEESSLEVSETSAEGEETPGMVIPVIGKRRGRGNKNG